MKRKNGALTLQGVGVLQGCMQHLNIDDVKCIRDALIKVYLPIIETDPELYRQYTTAVRSLRSINERQINERMERERQLAPEDRSPLLQAAAADACRQFGSAWGQIASDFFSAAASLLRRQQ